jgi:hydrophobic/amphiphilic exporter-1 (mainly G- bacteria), HAE1 family
MGISETCIRRPVMTTLLMASILLAGVSGYRQLPMAAIPRIDVPTIQVSASLPGASPDAMAVSVAAPLERQFATIAGVKDITSTSTEGATQVVLEFDLNRSIDAAALDVQSAISVATSRLPAEIAAPPSFRKVNPADSPVIFMALTSETAQSQVMNEFADKVMSPRLSMLPGVAQVNINGAQKRAVRIRYDLDALAARGIAIDELRTAVGSLTSVSPLGSIRTEKQIYILETNGCLLPAGGHCLAKWCTGTPAGCCAGGRFG